MTDLRYAVRQMGKSLGLTATLVLILGLGIGASTAIFSAVNPILFEPLPYPGARSILMIWDTYEGARSDVTFHTYRELADRARNFDSLAVMKAWQPALTGSAEPEQLDGQSVSAAYFRVLGVAPAMGRDFQPSDDQFKGPKVVILSHRLWQRRFEGDTSIVGHAIKLDGVLYTVAGIMPEGFDDVLAPSAEIWKTLQYDPGHITDFESQEWGHHLQMIGRLRPGATLVQVRRELDDIAKNRVAEFPRPPWASMRNGFVVASLQSEVTRGIRPALLAVLGAVALLLLIACVNVANLLLARGVQRKGEFAVRIALGAAEWRLLRQLLTESVLLALLGGVVGVGIAEIGVRLLVALSPPDLPRLSAIGIDGPVLAFAFATTTLVGIAVGMAPALHAFRSDLHLGMQQAASRTTGRHEWTRRTFVVIEVALAMVLLVSAGLLLHSLQRLFAVDPGLDASGLLTMQVQTSGPRLEDSNVGGARTRFFEQALESVRHVPGVEAAAFTSLLPLSGDANGSYGTKFENGSTYDTYRYVVTPNYFEAARIPLRRGRFLNEHDLAGTTHAVVINESLARRAAGGRDPLGMRVHVGPLDGPWYTVVGIVGDVKQTSLAESDADAVYLTSAQSWFADDSMSLVVRSRSEASSIAPEIRWAIWSVDKDQPIVRVATMGELLARLEVQRQFSLIVFQAFAFLGLVLAATGIYGVLSGSVSERTREMGIRAALGATPTNIVALVFYQGMGLVVAGVVIGVAGALLTTRVIATLLFGVSRIDLLTYSSMVGLILLVSAIACVVPASRASRVDPAATLRAE